METAELRNHVRRGMGTCESEAISTRTQRRKMIIIKVINTWMVRYARGANAYSNGRRSNRFGERSQKQMNKTCVVYEQGRPPGRRTPERAARSEPKSRFYASLRKFTRGKLERKTSRDYHF
jgi:hypothetical protein